MQTPLPNYRLRAVRVFSRFSVSFGRKHPGLTAILVINLLGSLLALPTQAQTTFSNPSTITTPDAGVANPYPSTIQVSGLTGSITKVTVTLNGLSHDTPGDMDMVLMSPGGSRIIILSDAGGSSPVTNLTLTLDDAAPSTVTTPMIGGSSKPTNVDDGTLDGNSIRLNSAFSQFNGQSPNGGWSLYIDEDEDQESDTQLAGGWQISITTDAPPTLTLTTSARPNPVCAGSSAALSVTATGGTAPYSYTWAAPAGVVLSGTSTAAITATPNAGVSGVQTLTITVADAASTPLTSTSFVSLTFNEPPANPALVASSTVSCGPTAITLTASPANLTYTFGAGATQLGQTNSATVNAPGTYSVVITGVGGCTASAQVTIGGNGSTPTVTITDDPSSFILSNGNSVTLTALGANSFTWSANAGGVTTATAVANTAGVYSVTGTTNGCSGTASVTVTVACGPVVYVTETGATSLNKDGTSWASAYDNTQLQTAIDQAAACTPKAEVWVAAGTYKPTTTISRTVSFTMREGVGIYGGFSGIETARTARNAQTNPTILSGDIGTVGVGSDNSFHVIFNNTNGLTAAAVLDGFVITGGNANGTGAGQNNGGGLYNFTVSPTLRNLRIEGNTAFSQGGALFAVDGSNSTVSNLTVVGNRANQGGGIFLFSASLTATNSLIQSNTASFEGGGLWANGGSTNLSSLTLTGNRATDGGGVLTTNNHSITATNSSIQSNTATRNGAGVFLFGGSSNLSSLTVTGNRTNNNGGGIFTGASHNLTATNTLFQSNTAASNGGGIYAAGGSSNLSSMTFTTNSASNGGGIYTLSNSLTATNTLLQSNTAVVGGGMNASGGSSNLSSMTFTANDAANGGGGFIVNGSLMLTGSLFQNNLSRGFCGGGVALDGSLARISSSTFVGNTAINRGGAMYTGSTTSLTLTDSFVQSNTATSVGGGGLLTFDASQALVGNTVFENNVASSGGGVYANGNLLTLTNSSVQNNTAVVNGGGIYAEGGTTTLTSLTVMGNTASRGGGIFSINTNSLTAVNTLIGQNIATGSGLGGGLMASGSTSRLESVTLTGNRGVVGGAVYLSSQTLTALNTRLLSNSATTEGGGMYASGSTGVVVNSLWEDNAATSAGGGYRSSSSSLTLTNASFRNNTAGSAGNALIGDEQTHLVNTIVWGNGAAANSIQTTGNPITASHSLFETGTTNFTGDPTNILTSTSPFVGATGPQLSATSEAIDAGLNIAPGLSLVSTDLLGQTRVVNCSVDLGAVETQTSAATVVIAQQPAASSAVCEGQTVRPFVVARGSNLNYQWFKDGLAVSGQASATLNLPSVVVGDAGSYSVVVTRACPMSVASATSTAFSLSVNPASVSITITPLANASPGSGTLTCAQPSLTLTAIGNGTGVAWSTLESTTSIVVNTAGVYAVTVTNATGCTNTASVTIVADQTAPAMATLTVAPSATLTCLQPSLTLTASATGQNLNYVFGNMNGPLTTQSTTNTLTTSTGGVYSVTITDTATGCFNTATTNVLSDTAPPAVSISASAPAFGCGITSITLTANVSSGASYRWDNGTNTPTRVITAAGTYGLSATATNGCSATATSVTIGVGNNMLPTVTLVFNNSATVMGSGTPTITVPATPGQQFQVLGGNSYEYVSVLDRINGYEIRTKEFNSTGVFEIKRLGPFSVTVNDGTGCSRTVQGILTNP